MPTTVSGGAEDPPHWAQKDPVSGKPIWEKILVKFLLKGGK